MVFPPEFYWRVLDLVPWWCWLLAVSVLLVVAGVSELLSARAVRLEVASLPVAAEARPEGSTDRVVSGS